MSATRVPLYRPCAQLKNKQTLMEEKKKRYVRVSYINLLYIFNKLLWMPFLYDYDLVCGSFFTD